MMRSLAVFCGSRMGKHPIYKDLAIQLGKAIATRNITLVYGGGDVGLMGTIAQTVIEANGRVIGVMPKFLQEREGHFKGTEYTIVETMHQRKAVMADRSDAFLILPGGYGTMDEFMEIVTWRQLGLHDKPIGVLNVNGYYNHLLAHLDHMTNEGFMSKKDRALIFDGLHINLVLDELNTSLRRILS